MASRAWLLFWCLGLVLFLLAISIPAPLYRLEYTAIKNRLGMPLRVIVYFPDPPTYARAPAAVLCQPFNDPPEYARLLALELVQDGFVVLTFDWRGEAPGENRQLLRTGIQAAMRADVAAVVDHLRGREGIDPNHVVIAGHSVGGTLAIESAADAPRIAGVASIGMEADVTPAQPRNLLWAVGLYDEFRMLSRMQGVFQASAATAALENTTVGDFARGTARRLGVSPTSDHFTELQDRRIHRLVRDWFLRAVGLPADSPPLRMEVRELLLLLARIAAWLGALLTLRRLSGGRRWVLRAANGFALLSVVLLSQLTGPHFLLASDAIVGLILFALFGGPVSTMETKELERGCRFFLRLGLALWAGLFLTLVVNNIANYAREPRYLLFLPEFALRHVLDWVYAYPLLDSRPLFFSAYTPQAVTPHVWVYALIGIEILSPGCLLGLILKLARRRHSLGPGRRPQRVVSLAILIILLGFLGSVVWLRIEQGFLGAESALAALRFLMRFTVLPIFIFAFLWRRLRFVEADSFLPRSVSCRLAGLRS